MTLEYRESEQADVPLSLGGVLSAIAVVSVMVIVSGGISFLVLGDDFFGIPK